MSFELIHKPTFTNQLLAIPKARVVQILEKTTILTENPSPHGSQKKKLHGYTGNVYRLRSGDYRVLYTYGSGLVTLLGVSPAPQRGSPRTPQLLTGFDTDHWNVGIGDPS